VSTLNGWPYQRTIEPAGKRFAAFVKKKAGEFHDEEEEKQETTGNAEEDADFTARLAGKHKTWTKEKAEDYYELLGLGDLRWRANADEIKAAYRKMILIYHPDKMKAASDKNQEINDEIFKSIQKAYDVLSDFKKRRSYDSTEEFDDSIPSERAADRDDFFKLFDPVFERNARWSNIQPAPKLGDINTPYDQVKKFYDFWWEFKSWRDFRSEDEYDLEQADSREEKRWMEKQNEKLTAPLVRQERARLLKLTELAHKKDPRVRKMETEREEEKKRKKDAVKEERRKQQEAIEREIALEKQKKEEEEKKKADEAAEAKKKKERESKLLKKKRSRLRELCRNLSTPVNDEHVDIICMRLTAVQLEDLMKSMQPADKPPTGVPLDDLYYSMKQEEREKEEKQKAEEQRRKQDQNRPWSEEELANLAKGLAKYPGGMSNRWDLIADLIPTRSPKDIAAKVKEVKNAQTYTNKASVMQVKDPFEKLKAHVGEKDIQSPLTQRDDEIPAATSAPSPPTATPTPSAPSAAAAKASKPAAKPADTATPTPAPTPTPAAAAAAPAPAPAEWSADEQKALERGLQQVQAGDDRWDKIAELVKTKTKKECVARYKYLVTLYKGKK